MSVWSPASEAGGRWFDSSPGNQKTFGRSGVEVARLAEDQQDPGQYRRAAPWARRPRERRRSRTAEMGVRFASGPLRLAMSRRLAPPRDICSLNTSIASKPHSLRASNKVLGRASEWDRHRAVTPASLRLGGSIPHTPTAGTSANGRPRVLETRSGGSSPPVPTNFHAAVAQESGATVPRWPMRVRIPSAAPRTPRPRAGHALDKQIGRAHV